jgi:hypothetical protein
MDNRFQMREGPGGQVNGFFFLPRGEMEWIFGSPLLDAKSMMFFPILLETMAGCTITICNAFL